MTLGILDANLDENSVLFFGNNCNEKAKEIRAYILNKKSNNNFISVEKSIADEIEKFALLKDKGVLTEVEFNQKKKDLLNSKL